MTTRLQLCSLAMLSALSLGAAGTASALTITSGFDTSEEGWTHTGAAVFEQRDAGGNPDGFLYIDNSEGDVTYLYAPSQFLGDLSSFDGGSLSFDGNMLGIGGFPWTDPRDYGHVRLSGGGVTAEIDLLPDPGQPLENQWTTYTVSLDATSWGLSQADWTTLLADVDEIRISMEAMFGGEVQGLDNFTLQGTEIPVPAAAPLLMSVLLMLGGAFRRKR